MKKTALLLWALPAGGVLWAAWYLYDRNKQGKATGQGEEMKINHPYKIDAAARKWLPTIYAWAKRLQVDPYFFAAMIAKESSFNPNAFRREAKYKWGSNPDYPEGGDASYGFCQILFSTAKGIGYTGGPKSLYDPDINLLWGGTLFKSLYKKYGNYKDVFAAYNSGKPYAKAPTVTQTDYVPKATDYAASFKQQDAFKGLA